MAVAPRTYGGWRRKRSIGLFGAGLGVSLGFLGAILVLMLMSLVAPHLVRYYLPVLGVALICALVPVQGESLLTFMVGKLQWWWSSARGRNTYRSGASIRQPYVRSLPGVLAPLTLLSVGGGKGPSYGVVWNRRLGHMTATILVSANSVWLAEPKDVDTWVANWHTWLAGLGYMPWLLWVAVTVENAPDPGATLRDTLGGAVDERAPAAARAILSDLMAIAPAVSAQTESRVTITFDPRKFPSQPKDRYEAAAEVGNYLSQIESGLGNCGVTVLGRATPEQTMAMVTTAFNPGLRGDTHHVQATEPTSVRTRDWSQATPRGADVLHGHYVHDGGASCSWVWQQAPKTHVTSTVLSRLLAPTRWTKRTTLLFRIMPASSAARVLEAQNAAAEYKSELSWRVRHRVSASDRQDIAYAKQAAREETMGAGLVQMSMYASITVEDESELERAIAYMESISETSRIRLRRAWGSQDVAFATTLPLGVCPPYLIQRNYA